jgi:hypothetical protein
MKRIDNFILQTAQAVYRHKLHNDDNRFVGELRELYDDISSIQDIKPIYTSSLYIADSYAIYLNKATASTINGLYNSKDKILGSIEYERNELFERMVLLPNNIGNVLFSLYYIYGSRILGNEFVKTRLHNIVHTNIVNDFDYKTDKFFSISNPVLGERYKEILKGIFRLLSLTQIAQQSKGGSHALADIYRDIHIGEDPPVAIPMQLYLFSAVKQMYLRYIMLNPDDTRFVEIFKQIYANADQRNQRALYFFSQTIPAYKVTSNAYSNSALDKWYKKEITEKQLDDVFDDVIKEERRTFDELAVMGIGISIDANLRLTKKRFKSIKKYVESYHLAHYKELAGPFLINESCMLACKILRRQIND